MIPLESVVRPSRLRGDRPVREPHGRTRAWAVVSGVGLGLASFMAGTTPWPWRWVCIVSAVTFGLGIALQLVVDFRGRDAGAPTKRKGSGRRGLAGVSAAVLTCSVAFGVSGAMDRLIDRPAVTQVVQRWGNAQWTVRPLLPGTRPIVLVDEGDLATVCQLSGWAGDQACIGAGLSPRLDYGTKPQLVALDRGHDGRYVAVMSYTDASDQTTPRWVGLSITRACGATVWCVEKFADLPLSDTPDPATASAVLANVVRCSPGGRAC